VLVAVIRFRAFRLNVSNDARQTLLRVAIKQRQQVHIYLALKLLNHGRKQQNCLLPPDMLADNPRWAVGTIHGSFRPRTQMRCIIP
jgi:hypothetical protein